MVIYLQRKVKKIIIYVVVFLFVIISYLLSDIFVYFRYDDKEYVDNKLLEIENIELKERYDELSNFIDGDIKEFNYIIGKVKYRDMYRFYEEIIVNVNDVDVGNAVVNSEGLIGVVSDNKDNNVSVRLLTSKYNVSVSVGECYGNLSNGKVDMIEKECNVSVGDKLYTSGLNDIVKGIYVGEVSNIVEDELGLILEVKLIDNRNLNYVGVIK